MLILQTTINTSKRFLDYSNYEYALAHRKILQTYNNSAKVTQEKHYIIMKSKDDSEDVRINFNDNQIYMDKFKNSNDFAGYILLLKHIKGYTLSVEDDTIHILIVDKNNHEHDMFLKIKDEKTDKLTPTIGQSVKDVEKQQKPSIIEKVNSNREVKYVYPEDITDTLARKKWRQQTRNELHRLEREIHLES